MLIVGIFFLKFSNEPGEKIDEWNGVGVYHNGLMNSVHGRNVSSSGYNLGLKWQCVEFVKRYYFEHLGHQMPNSYGHAKDFFDENLEDGEWNSTRGLIQFSNESVSKPMENDILVFEASKWNSYGHVGIVIESTLGEIEMIQQNDILRGARRRISIENRNGKWIVKNSRVLGWLRKR